MRYLNILRPPTPPKPTPSLLLWFDSPRTLTINYLSLAAWIVNIIPSNIQKQRLHRHRLNPRRIRDQVLQIHAVGGILVQSLDDRRRRREVLLRRYLGVPREVVELDEGAVVRCQFLDSFPQRLEGLGGDVELCEGGRGWGLGGALLKGGGGERFGAEEEGEDLAVVGEEGVGVGDVEAPAER